MPAVSVVLPPGASVATRVFRQNGWDENACVTRMVALLQQLTVKIVPLSAFPGRPPAAGGLNRGSRQVPVHVGGSRGSILAFAWVSLYETSVRYGVLLPSMLGSQRVFQKISLPLKNARFTPAARAVSTFARCPPDQYSSCPTDMNTPWCRSLVAPVLFASAACEQLNMFPLS